MPKNTQPSAPTEGYSQKTVSNKMLPQETHSIQAEQSVIGGLILNNQAFEAIHKKLNAEDFYFFAHKLLFNIFIDLAKESKPFDIVILSEELKNLNQLEEIGGEIYLYELVHNTPSAANIDAYADTVLEKSCERQFFDNAIYSENLCLKDIIQLSINKQKVLLERLNHNSHSMISFRKVSDIESKPIRWLWKERIARGKVSMLAGNPGLGKSQITASIAAIVTTGGKFPVDKSLCEQGSVIFLSAEDSPEDTIRPRLEAAGANLEKVFIMEAISDKNNQTMRAFNLKTDLAQLDTALSRDEYKDVSLIIIDPITAYLGDVDSHRNSDIRALLTPLAELAAKHDVAILCVSHLNKGSGQEALMRVTGSLAFVAAARAAFIVVKDKDDARKRLFLPIKNNNGNDQTGLAFTVETHTLNNTIQTSRINWLGETVTKTADEAMSLQINHEENNALQEAKDFLIGLLESSHSMSVKEIQKESQEAGHAWRTIRRAKEALGIKPEKSGLKEGWIWKLPLKMSKNYEDAHTETMDTFKEFGHLQKSINSHQCFSDPVNNRQLTGNNIYEI